MSDESRDGWLFRPERPASRQEGGACKAEQGVAPERTGSYVRTQRRSDNAAGAPYRRLALLALLFGILLAFTTGCGRKGAPIAPEDVPKPAKQSSQSSHTQTPDPSNREQPQ
jgi:predicted small lipoprotein YifL